MYTKIIRSGDILEIYQYEKEPAKKSNFRKQRAKGVIKRYSRRKDNLARCKRDFKRLVWANLSGEERPILVTLTMLQVVEIKSAYEELTAFFNRLRRRKEFSREFRYIAVPEFQKRGAVHFHILIWGFPVVAQNERGTRYLQRQWLRGFCDLLPTDGSPRLANYLAKYMSKGMSDIRLVGKKAYSSSGNIMRSVSLSGSVQTSYFSETLGVDNFVVDRIKRFDTLWLGKAVYKKAKIIV